MSVVYTSNLVLYTHTDFDQTFILEDATQNSIINVQNYTISAQFRKYSSSSVAGTFSTQVPNNSIGRVVISLTADQTKTLKPGKYFYDLNITSPTGEKTRVIEGTLIVKKAVTR